VPDPTTDEVRALRRILSQSRGTAATLRALTGYGILDRFIPGFSEAMRFVPPAVLSAIILPELVVRNGAIDLSLTNPRLIAGALAALSGRPDVVLPLAGAAEIAYLAILSSNARFQSLAAAVDGASGDAGGEEPGGTAATLAALTPADRARYQRLSDLCTRLRRLSVGDAGQEPLGIPDLQLQNIDRLLRIYLRLLAGKTNLERFFATVDPGELQRDLARARERLTVLEAEEDDGSSRTAKRRETVLDTIATIEKRQENYRLVQENHDSIVLELERLHTKIAGIAEMGIDRQDAASVGREIDLVTSSVEGTERTMREIEDLAGVSSPGAAQAPAGGGRRPVSGGVRA
jgi:uncharacterized membrane protein